MRVKRLPPGAATGLSQRETVGGGIEWAIYNNWSIKGEYVFIGSGHGLTTCGFAAVPGGAAVAGGQFCFNHEFPGIHTAKIGMNYRFNSAGRD